MKFKDFSKINLGRCQALNGFNHKLNSWSLSDWFTATMGELGEAANIAKKLNRVRDGIPGNKETPGELRQNLADEIADVFIYLDLLAQSEDICLEDAVITKFNKTSEKVGYVQIAFDTESEEESPEHAGEQAGSNGHLMICSKDSGPVEDCHICNPASPPTANGEQAEGGQDGK